MEDKLIEEGKKSKPKHKKKRSFMQITKRIARNNIGSPIEHEYFVRVLQLERCFEGTLEEKKIFVNNALSQTEGREVELANNKLISRVVDSLLPLASNEVLERYFKSLGENLRPVCVHDYASHVLQSLMVVATGRVLLAEQCIKTEIEDEHEQGAEGDKDPDQDMIVIKQEPVDDEGHNGSNLKRKRNRDERKSEIRSSKKLKIDKESGIGKNQLNSDINTQEIKDCVEKCIKEMEESTQAQQKKVKISKDEIIHSTQCKQWVLKVSRFLLNNIEEFMWDSCANFVIRTAMLCLAGTPEKDKHNRPVSSGGSSSEDTPKSASNETPPEFTTLLEEFYEKVASWPQFKDFLYDPLPSAFLLTLLLALKPANKKKYKELCKKVLKQCLPEDIDSKCPILTNPLSMIVLETMIEQNKPKFHRKIFDQVLAKNLVEMSTESVGSITVRKFLNKTNDPALVLECQAKLLSKLSKLLPRNAAVLVSLCQACERTKTAQTEFFNALLKYLHCEVSGEDKQQLAAALLSLAPLPHTSTTPPLINKNGSLILQSLLKFQKPIKVVNSLLAYNPKQLAELLSSHYGCFVTKAFCESEFIGEKSRLRLIQKLMGNYSFLAQSQFGSRSFDDIWSVADIKSKSIIVKDLSSGFSEVMSSKFGSFVASKVFLELYRSAGVEKWTSKIQSIQKKKNLFASIIKDVV